MNFWQRIYADYFMPSRLDEYERLIVRALQENYTHLTIPAFYNKAKNGEVDRKQKYFIHRHDIDTDCSTARKFFEIEKKHSIQTSYYFRLSTLDIKLMQEIHEYGSEVGYHFEELSTYCKKHNIKSAVEAQKHFPFIINEFKKNFKEVEKKCEFKIKTIASHGDFINRKLKISNFAFITSELLNEFSIDFECYDPLLLMNYKTILSDGSYPTFFTPKNPSDCIKEQHDIVYLLSHPRHWRVAWLENSKDNINRVLEEINYRL